MSTNSARLADRRERLIKQVAEQRIGLAQNIEPWCVPLARLDQGLAALRAIRRNPVWIIGGGVLLAALLRGNSIKWLRRSLLVWQVLSGLRRKKQELEPPKKLPGAAGRQSPPGSGPVMASPGACTSGSSSPKK